MGKMKIKKTDKEISITIQM